MLLSLSLQERARLYRSVKRHLFFTSEVVCSASCIKVQLAKSMRTHACTLSEGLRGNEESFLPVVAGSSSRPTRFHETVKMSPPNDFWNPFASLATNVTSALWPAHTTCPRHKRTLAGSHIALPEILNAVEAHVARYIGTL